MAKKLLKGEALLEILQITDRNRYVKWVRPGLETIRLDVDMAIAILKASLDSYEGRATSRRVYVLRDLAPAPTLPWEKPGGTPKWCWRSHEAPVLQPSVIWFEAMGYNRARFSLA